MIIVRKFGVRIGYTFYDDSANALRADVLRQIQLLTVLPGIECNPFYSMLLNLQQSEASLFARIKKDTRNEIRRADQRDGVASKQIACPTDEQFRCFSNFYNAFASSKGLEAIDALQASGWAKVGALHLSCATSAGQVLVWHAYYTAPPRARLLYSASLFRTVANTQDRNLISRANRMLHWHDILNFKMHGFDTYDLGGWYQGSIDQAKLQINRFKEEFGGEVTQFFNCERAVTLMGRMALWASSHSGTSRKVPLSTASQKNKGMAVN